MNDKEIKITNLKGPSKSMGLQGRLALAPTQPARGLPLVTKRHSNRELWPWADGYVATAEWITDWFQHNPLDGLGDQPRYELDLAGCVPILA